MGWFQELIHTRLINDEELLKEAFADLSAPVMGKEAAYRLFAGEKARAGAAGAEAALGEILDYYGAARGEAPEGAGPEELEYLLRPSGILKRPVHLSGEWYKDSVGPLLGERDGRPAALLPGRCGGYRFRDESTGRWRKVTGKNAPSIGREAFCFYRPLPQRPLRTRDLLRFLAGTVPGAEIAALAIFLLAGAVLGMAFPLVTRIVFTAVIPGGAAGFLVPAMLALCGAVCSGALFSVCRNLLEARLSGRMRIALEAAFMGRLLSLPAAFFRRYSSGELAERVNVSGPLCGALSGTVLPLALNLLFSLLYVGQIFAYTPAMGLPALGILALIIVFSLMVIAKQSALLKARLRDSSKTGGLVFELITGVQKIKLVGGETRAFAQWAKTYKPVALADFAPPLIIKLAAPVTSLVSLLGMVFLYYSAGRSAVALADFMAFAAAYGMAGAAALFLSASAGSLAWTRGALTMLRPLMEACPEIQPEKEIVSRLSGAIELNNVSFRYDKNLPLVIDNLSLKIRKGQYVAVVGKTGCGKSTLIRLLLGFEKPQLGSIYYDSRDMEKLDLLSLRRRIGVVMQSGDLLQGSVFENIAIAAPRLGIEGAWEALETAGLAEDIRAMPMGIFTILGEGGGGLSGGQKQRLLIARAIAAKPGVLILDEATSALDNITQQRVAEAMDRFNCTRLVIAHRLSTIRRCDRIIVLDQGRLAEDGSYGELIAKGGLFAELAARQQLDR